VTGSGRPFYHVAFLADDLQAAIRYWTDAVGTEFYPAVTSRLRLRKGDAEADADIRLTFSVAGPPWIELIERSAHDPFASSASGTLHHVGIVVQGDPGPAAPEQDADGTYVVSGAGAELAWFSPPRPGGQRVERVSADYYAQFEGWLARLSQAAARPTAADAQPAAGP